MKSLSPARKSSGSSSSSGIRLRRTRKRFPQKTAVRCGATAWTYADFDDVCNRLAAGLAAIDRIDRKEHDVAVAGGRVHDRWMLGDFIAPLDQTGNEQFFLVGIAENHACPVRWGYHAVAVAPLLIGDRRRFPNLGGQLFGSLRCRAANGEVRIVHAAAARGAGV